MKVLKTKWVQENANVIDHALIIPKVTSFTREDVEVINSQEEGEAFVEWKSRAQCTCFFEVYPDKESFDKRVYPIAVFKKTVYMPFDEMMTIMSAGKEAKPVDFIDFFLQSLMEDGEAVGQDFSNAELDTVELKPYVVPTLKAV